MKNPISLLLALLLAVSSSSCSKPNLAAIVREHIAAVNNDDIEKNLTFFTEDSVFEPDAATKLSGRAQVRNLMEWDVANHARLSLKDLKVEGDTVIAELTENNEGWRLLGIESPFTATYEFRGRQIRRVKLEFSPESRKIFEDAFKPFAAWAERAYPEEYQRMNGAGYSAEGARLFLSLAKEWKEKIQKEGVEQELKELEEEIGHAWATRDAASYDRILADDYIWTDYDGIVWTKAQDLEDLRSGQVVNTSYFEDDWQVRVYGDAAVVTGRTTVKETWKGKDTSGQYRYTDTWVKRGGRWQLLASHTSKIARK
jgi:ketosteroid isomerase-like protein